MFVPSAYCNALSLKIINVAYTYVRKVLHALYVKARSHRGGAWGTHGRHIGNLQFCCQCVVVIRYSFVERAGPTLCIRRHSLCALCAFFEHAQKCARSSTH